MTAPDEYTAQHIEEEAALEEEEQLQGRPYEITAVQSSGLFRELVRDKLGLLSAIFLAVLLLAAIFAPLIAPEDPNRGNLGNAMASPVWNGGTWSNPMGTDWQGYDVFSRLLYGGRTSLFIGLFVVVLAGTFGVAMGLIAGYRGGRPALRRATTCSRHTVKMPAATTSTEPTIMFAVSASPKMPTPMIEAKTSCR